MLVAEHLDLDMARVLDEFLDEHAVVAERRQPLALGRLEPFADIGLAVRQPHPLAAAAGRRLHHHRIADLAGDPHRLVGIGNLAEIARHDRHARRLGELLRFDLVAHRRDRVRRRPDEGDPRRGERLDEARALGQEAIARMHRLGPRRLARIDDQLGLEIGLRRRRRPDPHALVGHPHMRRARIGIGINRDRRNPHRLGGADHATGNFARGWRSGFSRTSMAVLQLSPLDSDEPVRTTPGRSLPNCRDPSMPCRCRSHFDACALNAS